ncbi:hypothetical protein V6N13_108342 [Hibiscus sabdariffa]
MRITCFISLMNRQSLQVYALMLKLAAGKACPTSIHNIGENMDCAIIHAIAMRNRESKRYGYELVMQRNIAALGVFSHKKLRIILWVMLLDSPSFVFAVRVCDLNSALFQPKNSFSFYFLPRKYHFHILRSGMLRGEKSLKQLG